MTFPWYNPGRKTLITAARGMIPADILFTNAEIFNPFTGDWEDTSFAVSDGIVIGTGSYRAIKEVDLKKRRVVPGLIDAHVHIESSLLAPPEFARMATRLAAGLRTGAPSGILAATVGWRQYAGPAS